MRLFTAAALVTLFGAQSPPTDRTSVESRIGEIDAELTLVQRRVALTGVNLTARWDQLYLERSLLEKTI